MKSYKFEFPLLEQNCVRELKLPGGVILLERV